MVKKKDIAVCILLSIFTCGIYDMIWVVKLTNDMKQISKDMDIPNGGVALLLDLLTCGVYGDYWAYKMGAQVDEINCRLGKSDTNYTKWIYLGLCAFGFTRIILKAMMQDQINKFVENDALMQNQINKSVDSNE